MNQKGFAPIIIILGIVLILGIAGGAYYFGKNSNTAVKNHPVITPTPTSTSSAAPKVDETANWKTYTNQQSSYLFKYPDIATIQKDTVFLSGNPSLIDNLVIKLPQDPGVQSSPDNRIIVWKNLGVNIVDALSRDVWCNLLMNKFPDEPQYTCTPSRPDFPYGVVTTNGYKAYKATSPQIKGGEGSERYFIPHGNYVYEIILITLKTVNNGNTYGTSNDPIPDQILSTFKFTDTNVESGKYTCPENGYQNCMPILDAEGQKQCSKEALDWKKANCPNFTGAAY